MKQKYGSKTLVLKKKIFVKLNDFFLKKFILFSVLDHMDFDLISNLNKIKLQDENIFLISRYSKKFKFKFEIIKDLVFFTKFKNFFISFDSIISLENFFEKNITFQFFLIKNNFHFFFFKNCELFLNFKESNVQVYFLFLNFFFATLIFPLYILVIYLWNYAWNR